MLEESLAYICNGDVSYAIGQHPCQRTVFNHFGSPSGQEYLLPKWRVNPVPAQAKEDLIMGLSSLIIGYHIDEHYRTNQK
jgi:hypothetical protein